MKLLRIAFVFPMLLAPLCLAGCPTPHTAKPVNGSSPSPTAVKGGALSYRLLAIATKRGSAAYRTAASEFVLYGVDDKGSPVPLSIVDASGSPVDLSDPTFVGNVSSDFVCISASSGTYIVDRSTGIATLLDTAVIPADISAAQPVQVDASGRFYYALRGALVRASISGPAPVVEKTTLSEAGETVLPNIQVDPQGNVLAYVDRVQVDTGSGGEDTSPTPPPAPPTQYRTSATTQRLVKVFTANGGSQAVGQTNEWDRGFGIWRTGAGALFTNLGSSAGIYRVTIGQNGTVSSSVVPATEGLGFFAVKAPPLLVGAKAAIPIDFPRTVQSIRPGYAVFDGDAYERAYTDLLDSYFVQTGTSATAIYTLGQKAPDGFQTSALPGTQPHDMSVIDRYDPATKSETLIFSDFQTYDAKTFAVTKDDLVTVSAVRRSDGANVLGRVTANGSLEVTSDLSVQQMVALD